MTKKLLKFENVGCTPCATLQGYLDTEGIEVERIQVFDSPELASKYDIGSVPTVVLVDEQGEEISRVVGFNPPKIQELVSQL